jgi:lipoprotein-anchoring transpeptidase ErfK/SrfK
MRNRDLLGRVCLLLLGVVPLVPIVFGLVITSGATAGPGTPDAAVLAPRYVPVENAATAPLIHASSRLVPSSPVLAGPAGNGALVAAVTRPVALRQAPGGRPLAELPARTPFASPQVVWVARRVGRWLGVVSIAAGNGRLGWVRDSEVSLSRVTWELHVSLSARRLTVMHDGHVVARDVVAIGAPASPTPTGRFAVTDLLSTGDPTGPYGCCIVALSAFAPHAIQGWSGGYRIAIHSTPETWSIGQPVSHGCMRLTLAEGRWLLAHIPLGTPTFITA